MARPPLALGHHGTISVARDRGQWVARCRVHDLDDATRQVARWGPSRTAAQRALQDELRQRHGERAELLRPHSKLSDAVNVWMAKISERREDSTADTYRHWLDSVILPQLGGLRLYECDVAHVDAFFTRLERARRTVKQVDGTTREKIRYSANTRRTIRSIVASVLQQAVLHKALPSNPVRELERIESPKGQRKPPPRGLAWMTPHTWGSGRRAALRECVLPQGVRERPGRGRQVLLP